ncbi:MAG TPA: glycosyltransferase [Candidatus Saccharimonadales bacterium]|nr:glycosyltransferase [Candidatus Saccharimonadales bacterium]
MREPPRRVAFYYGGPREPNDQTNPYGGLLADALGRAGVQVRFETAFDEAWLGQHVGLIDVLHLHWPSHQYRGPDDATTEGQMRRMVERLGLARELGYRVVWTAHNIYPHDRTYADIDRRFRLELGQAADSIIAHCELAADAVRREFEPTARIFVIPHGNFIGVLEATVTREEARAAAGIGPDDFVYGFIGNLLPYKGLEELIAVFRQVDPGDSWLLISGGCRPDYATTLRGLAAGHPRIDIRAFDYAPGVEFVRVLQASEVVVLPFRASTTSGSLVQALSWPRPALVPAMGCLPTQMDAGAGILYPPDEPGALARAMREIRTRDLDAARAAAWGCAERADWDGIAKLTIEAYR